MPSAALRERDASLPTAETRLWQAFLAAGLALCALYALVPASHVVFRDLGIYTLVELGSIGAILVGLRVHRPAAAGAWLLIAGGLTLWTCGDVIWSVYSLLDRDPFPSAADLFYLAGYPFLALGLARLSRRAGPRDEGSTTLDAAIVAVGFAVIAWIFLVESYRANEGLDVVGSVVALAYPVGDVLLLGVAARFLLSDVWRLMSFRLLAAALLLTLVADAVFALGVTERISGSGVFVDTMLLAAIVLYGAAALHPSVRALAQPRPGRGPLGTRRLALVGIACLTPVAIVVVQALRGELPYIPASIGAILVLSGLAFARFATLTAQARRAANRESILSGYAAELLRSTGRDALFAVAGRAADELAEGKARFVDPGRGNHAFAAPVAVQGEVVAELVSDAKPSELAPVRDSLATVATELALALDRERLLEVERSAAATLTEQNERLRELDRMKDQFVGMVSHELRTPLTSMVGYLELLLEGEAGEVNAEQRQFLEIVSRSSERLNRLIDDILFVARIDAGKFTLELTDVDLVELADGAVGAARPAATHEGVEVSLTAPAHPLPLCADPTRIAQLLDNLISNAIKFTAKGGTVSVTVEPDDDVARVRVSDTGVGVPEDELGRLFERFFRASTATSVRGTGLGLSIVRSIADAHGGTVSVESEVGVGTTFTVDLPLQAQREQIAEHTPEEVAT